jgi:hypothetical protein
VPIGGTHLKRVAIDPQPGGLRFEGVLSSTGHLS